MIETWSRGDETDTTWDDILISLSTTVRRHPWWKARARLTLRLLDQFQVNPPSRIADVGCGWGVTLDALEERGHDVTGIDISRPMLSQLDRPGRRLIEADLTKDVPRDAEPHDVVMALDVIEHIDDDSAALARIASLAKPGGIVIISVPALPELFSEFDAIQGHRRRYTPESLRRCFVEAGLKPDRIFWWGAWLVPTLRRQRSKKRGNSDDSPAETYRKYLSLPPRPITWLLRLPFLLEQKRALQGKLTRGTSLFAVARCPT